MEGRCPLKQELYAVRKEFLLLIIGNQMRCTPDVCYRVSVSSRCLKSSYLNLGGGRPDTLQEILR